MVWDKPYEPARNKRLDPELYCRAGKVCFITIRAYRRQAPFIRDEFNRMILDLLRQEADKRDYALFTYCLMPDHLHYLISPKRDGISVLSFTDQYKGKSTNSSWKIGWRGKLWQPRSFDHVVSDEEDLLAIDKYMRENPVRKELVDTPDKWPWAGQINPLPL